jgi:CubicO group peptidase (beta-lactamase class C family)
MATNPYFLYDWAFDHFVGRTKELMDQGFRMLSLSHYGEGAAVRFAGVFDKRPRPPVRWFFGYTIQDFLWAYGQSVAEGFYPALVSATGGGANTRISGVFEQLPAQDATELTVDQDLAQFRAEVDKRAFDGWVAVTATIYDDTSHEPRVAAIWRRNHENVAWNVFAGLSHDDFQAHFDAQWAGWARLAFATGSTRGSLLAIYRDDQIGPIGRGFVARHGLTGEDYDKEHAHWLANGFHVVCLQGYGSGEGRRFAALFVNNETPVRRTLRMTGSPPVPAIDQAVIDLMKESNIRGAALAIVDGTRLVLARGYTWAEPDYPAVQPTTCFRLASVSKLVAALGIHQLMAEGAMHLGSALPGVLPLTNPDGSAPTNTAYLNGTVGSVLQYGGRFRRYEGESLAAAAAFGAPLPATHEMIASYMLTRPLLPQPNDRLDDFGYFLAGQVIKRARGKGTLMAAVAERLLKPLQIARLRTARSLPAAQPADEARYHSRDLSVAQSVMTPARPLVQRGYGDESLEMMETSGGLSGAVTDVARLLAAMNARPYTPLGRPAVESLILNAAVNNANGHGFDRLELFDKPNGLYRGPKGGLLHTSQSGAWFQTNGLSTVIVWNGQHTGRNLTLDQGDGAGWYPQFTRVLQAAAAHTWPSTDLFPSFGMAPLPTTQADWRWCKKCQGMFYGPGSPNHCPAGGAHDGQSSANYRLMLNSSFPYGQEGWRWCKKCQSLFFTGHGHGTCAAGGAHDPSSSGAYTLVNNSPYKEAQRNWRWCNKCQGLFFSGHGVGICPAGGGHDMARSGDYSVA